MKKIPLTQGKFALVDDDDYEYLSQWKWCMNGGYAVRFKSKKKNEVGVGSTHISMHRYILFGLKETDFEVDHVNGNGLDNRRENLRACKHEQNLKNMKKRINTSSKYKGVNKHQRGWQVFIWVNGKNIHGGCFPKEKEIEAAKSYDELAKKYYGDFAKLNFP